MQSMNETEAPKLPRVTPIREARQRQLIEATITAIARYGYAKLTLNHVASLAGLSPGIVNFHFRTKEQLLAATLDYLVEEYEAFWTQALNSAGESAAAKVDAMIEADFHPQVNSLGKVTVWYAFWAEAQANPSYRERISRLEAHYFEDARALFQRLIEEGGYAGINADAVAYGISAMMDGFWFDQMIDPASFDREEAKRICRLFLSGLFPRHFAGTPQPGRGAAIEALRGLQDERNRMLAALAERERTALDALARGESAEPGATPALPPEK
jgi:TetR/AcrR family transcriptional repressor of bet genes